jgi:hypothetical protein
MRGPDGNAVRPLEPAFLSGRSDEPICGTSPPEPPPLPFQLQDPARLQQVLVDCSLKNVRVDTVTEATEFGSGDELWDWIVWSNPIVESILADLGVTQDERAVIRRATQRLVDERAGGRPTATLANPVNIGVGTKR